MTVPARAFVSAGSNINPRAHLEAACAALQQRYGPLDISPVYESPAEGFEGPPFLNLVVSFTTEDPPRSILRTLAELEARAGRDRSAGKFSSRTLDLDLLLHADTVDPSLKLPHSDITRYAFVLRPLTDLTPNLRHPITNIPLHTLRPTHSTPKDLRAAPPINLPPGMPNP